MKRSRLHPFTGNAPIDCGNSSWPDLSTVLHAYPPSVASAPRRERIAKQLILANLGESLAIADLAQACALSRSHFSRAFKCTTGLSPQEWIRQQRIQRAKELIIGSALSLTQISLECGFCDQAHFCHIFTRSEG